MTDSFQVEQIDHVELYVPDRNAAAKWYHDVLGLDVIEEFKVWANDPAGPLMIGTRSGNTKLALFEGRPEGSRDMIGFHLVAFSVGAKSFLNFVTRLPSLDLYDDERRPVSADSVADHQMAFSIYFCDPYGHQLEITTYEYESVKSKLALPGDGSDSA